MGQELNRGGRLLPLQYASTTRPTTY